MEEFLVIVDMPNNGVFNTYYYKVDTETKDDAAVHIFGELDIDGELTDVFHGNAKLNEDGSGRYRVQEVNSNDDSYITVVPMKEIIKFCPENQS